MRHVISTYFECACGGTFEVDPQTADLLDAELCAISWRDDQFFAWIVDMLSRPYEVTPDELPCREDIPGCIERHNVSANEIAGVLVWQADRQHVADRFAA